jgi:hypothetical protein
MSRNVAILAGILAIVGALVAAIAALGGGDGGGEAVAHADPETDEGDVAAPPSEDDEARRAREHAEMLDREYPMHGLVTKTQVVVRMESEPEATQLGFVRIGAHLRIRGGEPERTPTCASGWYELYPRGYACAGQGIEVRDTPPDAGREMAADLSSALPYHYWFVKEPQVPEWHQLPSRDDQRAAAAHAARYLELLGAEDARRAAQLRAGELASEPPPPPEVARWLDHGFFVASNGVEVRSSRRFVRTVRGSYVKEAQLEERTGSQFQGVELGPLSDGGERTLPVAWAVRAARPMVRFEGPDGTLRMLDDDEADAIERLAIVEWRRRERVGDQLYHVVAGPDGADRWLRDWFVAVAELREPPSGVASDEPWVHVDISSQTLVLYRGETPIYATLVSTGVEGHDTPEGEFSIRRKMITDTMADLGADVGEDDRYRIEDVPWTQYFEGSVALHGAFWHGQFGMPRSHGCVNLAPRDAQYVFMHTWPEVPEGWHGVSTEGTGLRGSRVVVTR